MPARADAESSRSGPHVRPEARTPAMVDFDVAAPACQADDVSFYDAAADAAAGDAAQDVDDGIAIADGSPDDATMLCRVHRHDADGADDGCGPWVAMACCGHCAADGTCAARLPGGHGDAVHDLVMPPTALAVCESRTEPSRSRESLICTCLIWRLA